MSDENSDLGAPPPPSPDSAAELAEAAVESVEAVAGFAAAEQAPAPVEEVVAQVQETAAAPPLPAAPVPSAMPPLPAPPTPAPAPQMPTAPMPTPAGYPGVPAAPGFPGQPVAYAVAAPNPFTMSLKNLWDVQNDIWRGKVAQAFNRPKEVVARTAVSVWNWLTPFLANSLLFGLVVVAYLFATSRVANNALSWATGGYSGYYGPSAGTYFSGFFVAMVLMFGAFMIASLVVFITHKVGASPATWTDSVTVVAVSSTVLWLPLAATFLITMALPLAVTSFIVAVGMGGVVLMYFLLTYIGTTRGGPHKRSPLVPFAWFTVAGGVVMVLFFVLFGGLVLAI